MDRLLKICDSIEYYFNKKNNIEKKNIVLLGDGFFARGFLHHINRNKFHITQIYKDDFINPQDLMYSLQRNKTYEKSYHIRDLFYKQVDIKVKEEIKSIKLNDKDKIIINNDVYKYNYLVIGLGAQKTLADWKDNINNFVNLKNKSFGIVGMGPIGFEIGMILSKNNKIDMFDMLPKSKVLNYVSSLKKETLLDLLNKKNITTTYEKMYVSADYKHDISLLCIGTRPITLTQNFKVNEYLQCFDNTNEILNNVYMGGDCINSNKYIKTGQIAYQQGVYVAKRLNNDISEQQIFEYNPNGMSLNIGDKKVLIEGHNIVPDGIYPDIIVKLYSLFFV
jgi:NADH dehydrogenase FAD-containing subunit